MKHFRQLHTIFERAVCFSLVMTVVAVMAPGAFAGEGVFLLGNDTLQLGRASSGVASPRSAYWSYMNPASMVDLERRVDVNWYTVFPVLN